MKYRVIIVLAAVFTVLGIPTTARAATAPCQAVPNQACSSWETPAGGGTDLDVFQRRTAANTPLIVYVPSSTDPAEDFELVPVPAGATSIYPFAGVQAPVPSPSPSPTSTGSGTPAGLVNIEYTPRGVASGMCISDIDPLAGQPDELRTCNTAAGKYNPFQSFADTAAGAGDGTFEAFEDAPVSVTGTPTGLYLSDLLSDAGIGKGGYRIPVVSEPQSDGGLSAAQLWETNG